MLKQLQCELCGSTNLVKQDGMFVCQDCGTKYTVEEARKLMNGEGTVDVSGSTVKIDVSNELANLYLIARRARDDNNSENAAKYYDMILIKDPNSWEASFYVVYFKAMQCKIAEIESAAISVSNCVDTVLKLIKEHVADREEQIKAVQEVGGKSMVIALMLYNGAKNHYDGIDYQIKSNFTQQMINNCCAARDICYILGNSIDSIFGDYSELHVTATAAWKSGITFHKELMGYFAQKEANKGIINSYAAKIQKYDSSYVAPTFTTTSSSSSGGCYVATAVYGSYDCPQVWTLRRYRDYRLAETWYGRSFIRTYYAISPTLVKWFGQKKWFKKIWKKKLDKMVAELNADGFEDTPYEDKNW